VPVPTVIGEPRDARVRALLERVASAFPAGAKGVLIEGVRRLVDYQDPDYATSAAFDPSTGTPMAREAAALRPATDATGRMPDPRTAHSANQT